LSWFCSYVCNEIFILKTSDEDVRDELQEDCNIMGAASMLMCAHMARTVNAETQEWMYKFKDGFEAGFVSAGLLKKNSDDEIKDAQTGMIDDSLEDDIMVAVTNLNDIRRGLLPPHRHTLRHSPPAVKDGFEAGIVAADLLKKIREGKEAP